MIAWAVVLLAVAPARGEEVDLAAAQSQAVAAGQAYEAGDYESAVVGYRQAVELGLDHATVHYNLGNALFKSGQLGEAIASYRRAQRRSPRDSAVRVNLERARQLQVDEGLEPLGLPLFLRPLGWIYGRLSLNEWAWISIAAAFLLALNAIASQWGLAPRLPRRVVGWTFALVGLWAFGMAALHYHREVGRTTAVVTSPEVDVWSGPRETGYELLFKVHEGLEVFVTEEREGWSKVSLGGDLIGWVPTDDVEVI